MKLLIFSYYLHFCKNIRTKKSTQSGQALLGTKEKNNTFTIWARDVHKYIEWSPSCSPQKYLSIVESRLDLRSNTIEALGKKLQNFGLNRQPCIYFSEKTPRDKIPDLEAHLVEFCRPGGIIFKFNYPINDFFCIFCKKSILIFFSSTKIIATYINLHL